MASAPRSLPVLQPDDPPSPSRHENAAAGAACLLVLATLGFLQARLRLRVLLLDRFFPGAGWPTDAPGVVSAGFGVASCHAGLIRFRFPGLSPAAARATFVTLVAACHAVFLGVARI
jgi:hypothetical protein